MSRLHTLGVLFALLSGNARGQIQVVSPQWLADHFSDGSGWIAGSTATFGAPYYGEHLHGDLVWGASESGRAHCVDEDYTIPPPKPGLLHIVIVSRGVCSFVEKVRVAQRKGAHAVIIADNATSAIDDIQRVVIADAGEAADIRVPSVLVTTRDGIELINAAKKEEVVVQLSWNVPKRHFATVDLWMSSASESSMRFLSEFSAVRKALSTAVKFVPHYHIVGMQPGPSSKDYCTDDTAQFCTDDPDGSGPITGADVIEEDLRQLCIHELEQSSTVRELDKFGPARAEKYWSYVEVMRDACPLTGADDQHRFGKTCSTRLMQKVGINVTAVEECVKTDQDTKLWKQRTDVAWGPKALRINGWRYSGNREGVVVARAICSGFESPPNTCRNFGWAPREEARRSVPGAPQQVEQPPAVAASASSSEAEAASTTSITPSTMDGALGTLPMSMNQEHLSITTMLAVVGTIGVCALMLRRRQARLKAEEQTEASLHEQTLLYNRLT